MNRKHLSIYCIAHFWVDLACALVLFRTLSDRAYFAEAILIYNFCAFAMQMPLGLLADSLNRNGLVAASGCFLIALAYPISAFSSQTIPTAIIAGLGNALFHLGGGIDTLNHSEKKASALGIFVSPGALGLYLGTRWGNGFSPALWIGPLGLIIVGLLILVICRYPGSGLRSQNAPLSLEPAFSYRWLIPLFLVVVLRSYMGMNQSFTWKGEWYWGVILVFALVLGKMAGGLLMDRFGALKTSCWTLGLSAVFYPLSSLPIIGTLAVFFFNMTMPVTLWAVAKIIPGAKGFTFGLLTLGLFVGYLPSVYGLPSPLDQGWACAVISVISLILMILPFKEMTA